MSGKDLPHGVHLNEVRFVGSCLGSRQANDSGQKRKVASVQDKALDLGKQGVIWKWICKSKPQTLTAHNECHNIGCCERRTNSSTLDPSCTTETTSKGAEMLRRDKNEAICAMVE